MKDKSAVKRVSASNSFLAREVRAVLEMHALVLRGGDAKHIAQSLPVCSVIRKFRIMARRYEAAGGDAPDVVDVVPDDTEVAS